MMRRCEGENEETEFVKAVFLHERTDYIEEEEHAQ